MRSPRSTGPLAVLLSAALLTACGGGGPAAAPSPTPTPTVSPTASPAPRPVALDLLTGTAPRRTAPVVAVKVDNSVLARPYQRGLKESAVVYQELVEGGSTRLLAVLQSDAAPDVEIGPIRSVRESDIDLLRQYGGIAVAFSGGNTGVKSTFAKAARAGQVIDASYDAIPGAYRLAERRKDARNFFTTPAKLVSRKPGKGPVSIGLTFGPLPAGAVPMTAASAAFSTTSSLRIRPEAGTFVLSQGSSVLPVHPANVIVQYVKTPPSKYKDVVGNRTPYTVTTGAGKAVVLRDGRSITGTWKRVGYGATRFLDAAGRDVALKPGPTWVVLLPSAGSLTLS